VIVVTDAGPIIHLSQIHLLKLLPTLYEQILVPDLVYREVVVDGDLLPGSAELRRAKWIELVPHDPGAPLFQLLRSQLDPGEAAAIWLAAERKAALILSDDRPARLAAEQLGVAVRGTLGVLVEAKRRGEIPELAPVIGELRSQGVWLSERLVERVLAEVGERDLGT
jgi:predicted nucleic acid-binding protein